jgi:hypothetical protein
MKKAVSRFCAAGLTVMLVLGMLTPTTLASSTAASKATATVSATAYAGGRELNAQEQVIYSQLMTAIRKVASGKSQSTIFAVHPTGSSVTYNSKTNTLSGIDTKRLLAALLVDCPYELYWFDKSSTGGMGISLDANEKGVVTELRFSFAVSADYAGTSPYTTNAEKVKKAVAAAEKAQALVAKTTGTDYEKLVAYMDYICDAVVYNSAAARSSYTGSYGDPWQMIYVFDDDQTTNVVCEGYAKAFQYLCDLTDFTDGAVCYTITGTISGQGAYGIHMWNIVTMGNGESYLVDLTNRDIYSIGDSDFLFLVGNPANSDGTYTFEGPICAINFTYDDDLTTLYGDHSGKILTLALVDYIVSLVAT